METQPRPLLRLSLRRWVVAVLLTFIATLLWQAYGPWLYAGVAHGD